MRRTFSGVFLTVAASVGIASVPLASRAADEPRVRNFRLDYAATIGGLPEGAEVRVWQPVPPTTPHQTVHRLAHETPGPSSLQTEPKYGNQMLYFQTKAPASGQVEFKSSYRVQRREVLGLAGQPAQTTLSEQLRKQFLAANSKVPIGGKPLGLIRTVEFADDPLDMARQLYEEVERHVRYDKSRPGYGNGDVLWVCDSRFGNCTDFHSLFISLARAKGLPARFEIGFPLPPQRGAGKIAGYHCWAQFHINGRGWVPVDISEADKHPEMKKYYFGNLTEDRVTFTTGRDIDLVPKQAGPALNYFVYPHVEVDGKVVDRDKVSLKFGYQDL